MFECEIYSQNSELHILNALFSSQNYDFFFFLGIIVVFYTEVWGKKESGFNKKSLFSKWPILSSCYLYWYHHKML